jgi:hypothetical protein
MMPGLNDGHPMRTEPARVMPAHLRDSSAGTPATGWEGHGMDGLRLDLTEDGAAGRGLHSSTFRLNVSAFCGIGSAFTGV